MAKIKFPLKMADGAQVRTLEELREHFNLAAALGYYDDGRLVEWLESRYYDDEVKKIKALDSSSSDFKKHLCDILGVDLADNDYVDLADIAAKNERRERLKNFTADDKILNAVDRVAFSQEELDNLLNEHVTEIYLCGERFEIPWSIGNMTYIGVNNPKVGIADESSTSCFTWSKRLHPLQRTHNYFKDVPNADASATHIGKGIFFQNLQFEIDDLIRLAKAASYSSETATASTSGLTVSYEEAADLWRIAAEQGNVEAQFNLGYCYNYGRGTPKDMKEAVKWYRKAAEQGYAEAQFGLGCCYDLGRGVAKDRDKAIEWYRKSAEQGYEKAQYNLDFHSDEELRKDGDVKMGDKLKSRLLAYYALMANAYTGPEPMELYGVRRTIVDVNTDIPPGYRREARLPKDLKKR